MNFNNSLINNFIGTLEHIARIGLVTKETITRYDLCSKKNLHSLLQFCLISSALKSNMIAIPEFKVQFEKPLNPYSCDNRWNKKKRSIHQIKVDVAFLDDAKYLGFAECFTMDEIHGCHKSIELLDPWVSPSDKLLHMIRSVAREHHPGFALLVNIIPNNPQQIPSWPDVKKKGKAWFVQGQWAHCWKELGNKIQKSVPETYNIILNEEGVDVRNHSHAIRFKPM